MSVAICYVTDTMSIIATDTRVTRNTIGKQLSFSDDAIKLTSIPNLGWCSGVGSEGMINDFKKELLKNRNESITTRDIRLLYNNILLDYHSKLHDLSLKYDKKKERLEVANHKEKVNNTIIILTWIKLINYRLKCCIGLLSKDFTKKFDSFNEIQSIENNRIYIFYPPLDDQNKNIRNDIEEKYQLNFQSTMKYTDLLYEIFNIFDDIQSKSSSVSNIIDVGIHALRNKRDEIKINIRDDIHVLKTKLREGNIEDEYNIVEYNPICTR
ncbi:hypothetical protein GOQ27_15150 [Clostridium sp. D2Q-11]|uniref:Uncharacterized protein n=1 Tax=Anaeromonas frigoriresistens TaxID=2683708 RepID=A0A942ZAI7_9FIRM|nr:hypothetical protein [Anaeromonas frigoriresistens]MBS4539810.1 hypothetical protein [Anaeromonas frigoriresistens]